jgi:hypothetical protein
MPDFIPVDTTEDRPRLACPECGDDHVHPIGVNCWSPGTPNGFVGINSDGVRIDPTAKNSNRRGVRISLAFECEQGHSFEYCLTFHKGETHIEKDSCVAPGFNEETGEFDSDASSKTIWRD